MRPWMHPFLRGSHLQFKRNNHLPITHDNSQPSPPPHDIYQIIRFSPRFFELSVRLDPPILLLV